MVPIKLFMLPYLYIMYWYYKYVFVLKYIYKKNTELVYYDEDNNIFHVKYEKKIALLNNYKSYYYEINRKIKE